MPTDPDRISQKRIRAGGDVVAHQEIHNYGAAPQARDTLPARPDGFTGREADLQRLLEVLDPSVDSPGGGVVVSAVAGMGGVGKTALATVAGYVVRERNWFSLAVFHDLHGYSPEAAPTAAAQALESLLRALGVPAVHIPPTLDERAALYRSRLQEIAEERGAPVLVVADNAAEADQVEPLLPGRGGNRLLVTSRRHLALLQSVARVDLDVLSAPAAVELLRTALAHADPSDARADDDGGLTRVATGCGFLPLALRICAARLSRSPRLTPSRLADQLEDTARRLERLDLGDGRRAVRAAFDLSFRRLPPQQAGVFTLLALNPGPDLSTAAAAVLTGMGVGEVAEVLDDLTAAHLLTHDSSTGRWAMHDLLADYARHHLTELAESDPEVATVGQQTQDRLLEYYTATAEAANSYLSALPGDSASEDFADREEALAWLDAERANLLATVHTAQATSRTEIAIDLPLILAGYLHGRRYFDDSIAGLTIAQHAAQQFGDRHREASAWDHLGNNLLELRRLDDAIDAHTRARDLFAEVRDCRGEAHAWNNLGDDLRELRRFDDAIDAHTRARDLFAEVGDRLGEASTWNNLGNDLRELRRFDDAIDAHTRARDVAHQVGDRRQEAVTWNNLGLALRGLRRFDDAIDALTQARDVYREVGDRHREAVTWTNLGLVLRGLRRFDDAIHAHTRAGELYVETGDRLGEASAWNNLGAALLELRRFDDAIHVLTLARDVAHEAGDRHGEASVWNNLGNALLELRRFDDAIDAYRHFLVFCRKAGDRHREATAWNNLGSALVELRRFDDAIHAHTRASELYAETGDRHGEASAWNNLGLALRRLQRFDDAIHALTRARDLHAESRDLHREAMAGANLGSVLLRLWRFDDAIDALERSEALFAETRDTDSTEVVASLLKKAREETEHS
ncbi:tetratricopeptide repeat protein [Saccharopolyspora shandongensis]|uniref:tetratricopeptide repeat protein n=1 Tax=Saccharopolyspora shandongensis TaxID=418495 RepID=UPI0034252510